MRSSAPIDCYILCCSLVTHFFHHRPLYFAVSLPYPFRDQRHLIHKRREWKKSKAADNKELMGLSRRQWLHAYQCRGSVIEPQAAGDARRPHEEATTAGSSSAARGKNWQARKIITPLVFHYIQSLSICRKERLVTEKKEEQENEKKKQ